MSMPSSTGVLAERASTAVELSAIVERQREAFLRDGAPSLKQRRADLARLKQAVKEAADHIADVISSDFAGRSRHETLLAEVLVVCAGLRHALRHLPSWMRPKRVSVSLELSPGRARILYQPLGVVGIISPWNYPFQLAVMPLIAALAAGNRVILKPSERTPRTAEFIADFLGGLFPAEQVATVLGGADIGEAFSRLPFDHLFYTCSAAVGRRVMKAAAENLIPVTLELGGKSPCILGADADLPRAVDSVLWGKLLNAGQSCLAPDYVLVPTAMREEFIRLAGQAVRKLYPTIKNNPDYTSTLDAGHLQRLVRYIEEAKTRGMRVVELAPSEEVFAQDGRKLMPVIVVEPDDELALMREEIFGPILPVKTYCRIQQAIDYVNRHPRPLALYYFGANTKERSMVLQQTTSGGAAVNDTLMHAPVDDLPFGGIGASGIGAYHGATGFRTFSHCKGVFLQSRLNLLRLLRPPFGRVASGMIRLMMMR